MRRKKYLFESRSQAEEMYREADRERLRAEWFATAALQGRLRRLRSCVDGTNMLDVGYFTTTHSAFVYVIVTNGDKIHCIRGLWESDSNQLRGVIAALMRYGDSHAFGAALHEAQAAAWKAVLDAA